MDARTVHGSVTYQPLSLPKLATFEFREPEMVVEGLLPRGSLTLLAGREKSGKSLLVSDLAACVAGGDPFLGRAVRAGPVILVPAEENLRDVWLRLERRLGGNTDPPLFVLPVNRGEDDLLDLNRPACLRGLNALVIAYAPAILILDPMRELHGLSENDADVMGPLLRPVRRLAHETDTAIVLVHHMSRAGNFRGSTAIRAAVDQEWAFRRPEDADGGDGEGLAGVLSVEGRFGPRQRLGIRLTEDLHWLSSLPAAAPPTSARTQVLTQLMVAELPLTAHEIAAFLGTSPKNVQNVLAEERRKGMPITIAGTGRKNDPFRYSLRAAA
jgi:hypothetical protein